MMKKILIMVLLAGSVFLIGCGNEKEVSLNNSDSEIVQNMDDTEEVQINQSKDMSEEVLISFRKGDKWGCMTLNGEVVIEPEYEMPLYFYGGPAVIQKNGKYGYINADNEIIVEPQYDYAWEFYEGFAGVCIKKTIGNQEFEKWGFINESGEEILELEYDEIGRFSEGLANVCIGGKWGYIDTEGNFVRMPQYDTATEFRDGTAVVTLGESERLIQRENFWIIMENNDPDISIWHNSYYDGLVYIDHVLERDENGMGLYITEYVDTSGESVIRHEWVEEFSEGLAAVYDDGYWGYVNAEDEWVIDPQYEKAGKFSEGLAVVASQGHQYLINTDGDIVFQSDHYDFYDVNYDDFHDLYTDNCMKGGMILAKDEENYYILNQTGEIIWEIPEKEVRSPIWLNIEHGGVAVWHEYDYSEEIAYIDENKNVIWDRRNYDY